MGALREELRLIFSWEEHHRRLVMRLEAVAVLTLAIDAVGSVAVYFAERHANDHTQIKSFGDALFFTTVQLLTVSSQIQNPFTPAGRVLDVVFELWAVIVVAGSAGAVAAFFQNADARRTKT